MGADADGRPVGAGRRVREGRLLAEAGHQEGVDQVRMATAVAAALQEGQVVGILDGLMFLEADLAAPVSGQVGAWAKSDTVVLFDSFSVDPTAQ